MKGRWQVPQAKIFKQQAGESYMRLLSLLIIASMVLAVIVVLSGVGINEIKAGILTSAGVAL
jgi:hypothetical protein